MGQFPNPPLPVGTINAVPTVVQTGLRPSLTWSIRLPATEDPANYTFFVRQTLWPTGVNHDSMVLSSGQMVSPLAFEPGAASFALWAVRISPLTSYLLDTTVCGSYLPTATMKIRTEDPYPHLPRTRADRPFWVDTNIQGLLNDPDAPDSSKSVTFLHHAQSYGPAGNGDAIDRTQATLVSQSSITINGAYSLVIHAHSIPGNAGANARGEERISLMTAADYQMPEQILKSEFIQVWPVAKAVINGLTEGQTIGPGVPAFGLQLNDLYPSSTTFAQIYKGSPRPNVKGRILPGTTIVINSSTPQNRSVSIQNDLPLFDSDGVWTLEVVTTTPFGTEPITAISFNVRGTASIREAWRLLHFGSNANNGDGADTNDFDHDGLNNLLEFAFGSNPKLADNGSIPLPLSVNDQLVIDFIQPTNVGGVIYEAEWSPDLNPDNWQPMENLALPPRHTFRLDKNAHPVAFMRIKVIGQ